MFKKYWKKALSLVLVFALLLQIAPMAVRAEESLPSDLECDPQTGMSALYEHTPFDAGMAGTAYVNTYLGTLHLRRSDLSLGGERMPVTIEFYHDPTNDVSGNTYGAGWSTSYSQLLNYDAQSGKYAYKDGNGTWIYFADSGETDESGNEIWAEDVQYGVGEVGVELLRPSTTDRSDYTAVDLICGDTHYSFDSDGRLVKIASGVNQITVSYVSGTSGSIECVTDPVGRKFFFTYTDGFLSAVQCKTTEGDVIPNTSVNYSVVNGQLAAVTYASGDAVTYGYDANGNIIRVMNVDLCGYAIEYTDTNRVSSVTAKAAMDTEEEVSGVVTTVEYPEENQTVVTADGTQQKYTFDGCGRVTNCELLMAASEIVTYSLNATQFQCVYGYNMVYGYVANDDGSVSHTIVDIEAYDADGVIEDTSEEETEPEETEPEETEPDNYGYTEDAYGNILTETYTEGNLKQITSYTYSEDGNYLASQTDADGNTVQYQYDLNTGLLDALVDANGNETEYTYNALRELQLVRMDVSNLVNSNEMAASYSYSKGRLVDLVYGAFQYHFTYDIWGNILTVTMNGKPLVSYNYGGSAHKGQVQTMTYGNGQNVYYTYNALGQIVTVGYTNQPDRFTYTYNADGALEQILDSVMDEVTTYTETGYEIRTTDDRLIYAYSADEDGNSTETVDGLTVQTSFNNNGATITVGNGSLVITTSRAYDAFNRLRNQTVTTGSVELVRNYSYQTGSDGSTGNLVSDYRAIYTIAGAEQTSLSFTYTYDGNGNITGITKTERSGNVVPVPKPVEPEPVVMSTTAASGRVNMEIVDLWTPKTNYSSSYSYDEAGQLVEAVDGETGIVYRYTYDASGNIQTMYSAQMSDEGVETFSQTKEFFYTDGILTGYGLGGRAYVQYETDTMGNPVKIIRGNSALVNVPPVEQTLSWGEGRMLLGISQDENNHIEYTYNTDGLRTCQVVTENGVSTATRYVWGNNGLAAVISNGQMVVPLYDDNGEAVGFMVATVNEDPRLAPTEEIYTYVKNLQGDVIRILDGDGNAVVSYTYDPWGVPTVHGDADLAAINPCSYRGYYYDEETGYYYLQSRYYDPAIGRFLSADAPGSVFLQIDKIVSANLFAYCLNNPTAHADHTGFVVTPANVIGAIFGVIGGSVIGTAIANYFNLKAPWRGLVIASTSVLLTVIGWFSGPAVYAAVKPVVIKAIQAGSLYLNKIAIWIQQTLGIIRPFADKALKNVGSYVVKTKHLLDSPGNYNKFVTDNMATIRGWITTALKCGTNFQVNSKDSYYVIYNMGRVIGTKGERCIKVVFDIAGKIITAYPVK